MRDDNWVQTVPDATNVFSLIYIYGNSIFLTLTDILKDGLLGDGRINDELFNEILKRYGVNSDRKIVIDFLDYRIFFELLNYLTEVENHVLGQNGYYSISERK